MLLGTSCEWTETFDWFTITFVGLLPVDRNSTSCNNCVFAFVHEL
jgi:hypothetical protein